MAWRMTVEVGQWMISSKSIIVLFLPIVKSLQCFWNGYKSLIGKVIAEKSQGYAQMWPDQDMVTFFSILYYFVF